MTKSKRSSRTKYKTTQKNIPEVSNYKELSDKAKKFLDSETKAAYATQAVLAVVLATGLLCTLAIAPGLGVVFRQYRRMKYYSDKEIKNAERTIRREGYIVVEKIGKERRVHLTKKGEEYFNKVLFGETKLPEPKKWNGKWTFILFDIPVAYKNGRDALRWHLRMLGCYQYQKSVWVYPHECTKEILFVADHFGVGKYVEVLSVERITKDAELKKHFDLK